MRKQVLMVSQEG